jgi:hypothetical protein
MSIEITLYTKTATKSGLIKFLLANNFQKTRHFLDSMNTPDMLHFMWFGFENYESSSGVEATVHNSSLEDRKKYNCTDWILHTRTRSSGSYEDKQKQNETIRTARQQFGGTFYNDWYGTNKYTDLSDYKKFSPLEKGISIIASNSLEKLGQIGNCLSGYRNEMSETLSNLTPESVRALLVTKDPSIVLYNSLMPFLVSVLEYFFGQCFANFIRYDATAKTLLVDEKIKIGVSDVVSILQKENSIEQIITQSYNFQNLDSISRAFKKYISIDVFSTLSKKKKINGNVFRVLTKVQEILDARHRFVHELDINYDLTKEMYLDYVAIVENAIRMILKAFETKGLKIEIEY